MEEWVGHNWNETEGESVSDSVLCPILRDPMNCSPPGLSVHGIFQARILEWLHALLQGIFPNQGSNPVLLHFRWILYLLSHKGTHSTLFWLLLKLLRVPLVPSLYFCVCLNKCQKKLLGNLKNNLGAFKAFPVVSQSVRSHKRKDWDSPLDRNFFKEKTKTEWQKKSHHW